MKIEHLDFVLSAFGETAQIDLYNSSSEKKTEKTLREHIREEMKGHPDRISRKTILASLRASNVPFSSGNFDMRLSMMIKKGEVIRIGYGKYRLSVSPLRLYQQDILSKYTSF